MRPVTSSTPVELLSARDRNLLLGCDSLPLGQAWPAEGVYVKRSTSFFGPDLTCAAQACGRPNGGELCLRISRLTGDSISEVGWNLIQWAATVQASRADWLKLWKGA
jgi:hypothetical protein